MSCIFAVILLHPRHGNMFVVRKTFITDLYCVCSQKRFMRFAFDVQRLPASQLGMGNNAKIISLFSALFFVDCDRRIRTSTGNNNKYRALLCREILPDNKILHTLLNLKPGKQYLRLHIFLRNGKSFE